MRAKLWRGKKAKVAEVHVWRPRRSRFGELVQWDTSDHGWLEGRGERLYLIAMIDDATSRLFARFIRHDSTEENMTLLWSYLEEFGRPVSFYTDNASHFQTAEKRKRDEPGVEKDPVEMPPTQIGRALRKLGITWIGALAAPLSHVKTRHVRRDYTLRWNGKFYPIDRAAVTSGFARSQRAGGAANGRNLGGAPWRPVSAHRRVRGSAEKESAA